MGRARNLDGARDAARVVLVPACKMNGREAYRIDAFFQAADSRFDAAAAAPVIDAAATGDPDARIALHTAIAWFLKEDVPIPAPLRQYMLEVLLQDQRDSKKPGPKEHATYLRDACIRAAVRAVMEYGFDRERNPLTKTPSACSIVKDVLAEIGIHMSEKNVGKIAPKGLS